MSGVYIHVPFCIQRCHYCDFYSTLRLKDRDGFVDALLKEIDERRDFITKENIDTIYFGGGTPSLLSAKSIKRILRTIYSTFKVSEDVEITLEANPDDLQIDYLEGLHSAGINRLSIGIQSFNDKDLKLLNRRHNSDEASNSVIKAKKAGFKSISIDLIYGLPGQDNYAWGANLKGAVELEVEHISAYHLTYEKGTQFYKWLKDGKLKEPLDELSLELFRTTINVLKDNGFEHYEISNFARGRKYSRHNTKYWFGNEYLGVGPSAHSYNGEKRYWNIPNLDKWMKAEEKNFEIELIDKATRRNEMIMTRLRTMWGIPEYEFSELFGQESWRHLIELSSAYFDSGLLLIEKNHLKLTEKGKFLADGIIADLFIV